MVACAGHRAAAGGLAQPELWHDAVLSPRSEMTQRPNYVYPPRPLAREPSRGPVLQPVVDASPNASPAHLVSVTLFHRTISVNSKFHGAVIV